MKGGLFGGKGAVSGGQYQGSGPFGKGFCSDMQSRWSDGESILVLSTGKLPIRGTHTGERRGISGSSSVKAGSMPRRLARRLMPSGAMPALLKNCNQRYEQTYSTYSYSTL